MRWPDLLVGGVSAASRVLIVIAAVCHAVAVSAVPNLWTPIGPDGGSISSIAVDRTNSTTVYAGTGAGLFVSVDGGVHWSPRGNRAVRDIRIDPRDSAILYALADHLPEGTALFRSTDGGQMWAVLTIAGGFHGYTSSVAIDPTNSQTLYAALGGGGGVYKSEDGGGTWYQPSNAFPDPGITLLAIDPNDPRILYGGSLYNVLKSTDAAQHWQPLKNGLPDAEIDVGSLAIDPTNSGTVYVGTQSGFFRSTDAGGTWTAIDADLPTPPIVDSIVFDPHLPGTVYIIGPGNCAGFFCTGTVYQSSGGDVHWQPLRTLRALGLMQSLTVAPNGDLYAGTDYGAGVLKSTDGGVNWEPGTGITNRTVRAFFVTGGESETLYADLGNILGDGLVRTTDRRDWRAVMLPDLVQPTFAISSTDPATIFAAERHGSRIVRSMDAGATWQEVGSLRDVVDLHIAPHSPVTLYAAAASGVFKSIDAGAYWTSLNNRLPPDGSVFALTLSPDGRTLFATVEICPVYGNDAPFDQLYRTTNEGMSWMEIVPYSNIISGTAIDPLVPTTIYLFGADGVAKSLDGGTTWATPTLPNTFVQSLVMDPTHPDTIYAGTETGLFKSVDGATSWRGFNTGLARRTGPLPDVTALLVSPADPKTVYAGTAGNSALVIQQVAACVGDCNVDGEVTVDELVKGVGIALGTALLSDCPEFDCNGGNDVGVDCLVQAVNAALNTCVAR